MKKKKVFSIDDHFSFDSMREIRTREGDYIKRARIYSCNYCCSKVFRSYCKEHYETLHNNKKLLNRRVY